MAAAASSREAWWCLALFLPCLGAAFAVGEGLLGLLGEPSGAQETPSLGLVVLAGAPALLVFTLPALACVHFGRRARRLGQERAMVPVTIAVSVTVAFAGLNLLAYVVQLVVG